MRRIDFHVDRLEAPVAAFSGGQRQAVAIGRAMYWNARLVIMDAPTAALGVPEQRTEGYWNNEGLCCGTAGIGRFFLDMYRRTNDAQYFGKAKQWHHFHLP